MIDWNAAERDLPICDIDGTPIVGRAYRVGGRDMPTAFRCAYHWCGERSEGRTPQPDKMMHRPGATQTTWRTNGRPFNE